jgi:DNA invertase Pin-like site-specific DNA recombinase
MMTNDDGFTSRMFDAINSMLLDMLAAIARKDYDDRRRRQAQGIAKAKAEGRMKGRPEDATRNEAIIAMLRSGQSWNTIVGATGASRSTLSRLAQRIKAGETNPNETAPGA